MIEDRRIRALTERQTHGKTILEAKYYEEIQLTLSVDGRSSTGAVTDIR